MTGLRDDDELKTPCGRSFKRAINMDDQRRMFGAAFTNGSTRYRGVPFLKMPNDVMIHMRLLHEAKPATVFEVGSKRGGSALWFADMISAMGIVPQIVSIDLKAPKLQDDRITFLQGDASRPGDVLSESFLAALPRPWLVSEDSAHTYAVSKAVLDFFGPRMRPGEYIVVEDGVVSEVAEWFGGQADGGPNKAVADFLGEQQEFEVVAELCDLFGYNVTGNPNGYLRRKAS